MWKAIILNSIAPITYIILLILLKFDKLGGREIFVAENVMFLWLFQLAGVVIGFLVSKNKTLRVSLVIVFVVFFLFGLITSDNFNRV
jgi:hypothetical protein